MEIVVNDTNILIDLFNAGLLSYCKQLDIEFRTLDVVINEIKVAEQFEAIQKIIEDGTLKVYSLSGKQIAEVFEKVAEYQGVCNLSAEDISVMVYVLDNKFRLLTGDKTLRTKASLENIKVSGVLYLIDEMINDSIVDNKDMISALNRLLESNNRLPTKLIKERIDTLEGIILQNGF